MQNGPLEIATTNGEVIKLEGEYEQVVGGDEIITRRVKEADKVLVPKFPSITNLKQWHNQLARNLVLASGRTDGQEVAWLNMVLADGAKIDLFELSGEARFATLDIKLHSALTVCIKEGNKALAAKLSNIEDE